MNIRLIVPIVFAFAFPNLVMPVDAQVVPGTGQQIVEVFDDFEDANWNFTLNLPKSSANIDKVERHPSGFSNNRLYLESLYRGTPDFVRRIETPAGGIPGSTGALAMQTLNSGVPGQLSHTFQQDDLIAGVQQKLGYMMPVSWTPSYVCRVYIPPFDKWERRHGSHFGFRADCLTTIEKPTIKGRFFKNFGTHKAQEQYWPGFFIQLNLKHMSGQPEDSAVILIRADQNGHEVPGPKITRAGWWTLGMSFTPDGQVHYYAHEGVADLTPKDHLYSGFPYSYRCEQTSTFFFNIVNQDDGRSWSTRWIVDDPKVYVATGSYRPPVQQQVAQKPAAAPQQPTVNSSQQTLPPTTTPSPVPVQPPVQANQSQTPVVRTMNIAAPASVSFAKPSATTSTSVPTPKPPTTAPSVSSMPKLASKPTQIPVEAPKKEALPETQTATPEKLPEPTPGSQPVLASPATETPVPLPNESAKPTAESQQPTVEPSTVLPPTIGAPPTAGSPQVPSAPAMPE